jgi:16S rRNA G966 N2-methylase RsmD
MVGDHHSATIGVVVVPSKNDTVDILLPGYEVGMDESGVTHSKNKLSKSAKLLGMLLWDHQTRNIMGMDDHHNNNYCPPTVRTKTINIQTLPCLTEAESWAYRCRCNFQIIVNATTTKATTTMTMTSGSIPPAMTVYQYAMRHKGRPINLGTYRFPIATYRIQNAMEDFMLLVLNSQHHHYDSSCGQCVDNKSTTTTTRTLSKEEDKVTSTNYNFLNIKQHLTSCTFSSAWNDSPPRRRRRRISDNNDEDYGVDCILTLHYDHPLDGVLWTEEATRVCSLLRLRRLNGRSRGVIFTVVGGMDGDDDDDDRNTTCSSIVDNVNVKYDNGYSTPTDTIRDTVYLSRRDTNDNEWVVSLEYPTRPSFEDDDHSSSCSTSTRTTPGLVLPVRYEKPETAFYHPNASAMMNALKWMLDRLLEIQQHHQKNLYPPRTTHQQQQQRQQRIQSHKSHGLRLLEMYCGCGAHTVALGKSGMVSKILAIELDSRLVQACVRNVELNSLQLIVDVRRGDAGRWAKDEEQRLSRYRGRQQHEVATLAINQDELSNDGGGCIDIDNDDDDRNVFFNVLLVDPPRQGLDDHVCRMATRGTAFRDFLYISCGHQALLHDLEKLAPTYEVIHCVQLDLFPRTDSIETLVHLRRRR